MRSPPTRKSRPSSSRCKLRRRPTTSARRSRSSRSPIPVALHVDESCLGRARRPRQRPLPHRLLASAPAQRDVQYSSASFHARATTTWLVNSEGTIVRKSSVEYQESFGAGTQAADGMRLDRSYGSSRHFARRPRLRGRLQQARRRRALPRSPICAKRRLSKRSITARCCSAPTPPPTRCARFLARAVTATRPASAPKRAPTARSPPATTRACCPTS